MDATNANAILIYDGDCGFCTRSAKLANRLGSRIEIATWQTFPLNSIDLTEHEASSAVQFRVDGQNYSGYLAVARCLEHLDSRFLRLIGRVGRIPPLPIPGQILYRVIAKYRYKLPGGTDSCRLE